MDDLVRWLGEQLNADEQTARAAADEDGPDWQYDGRAVLTRREGDLVAVGSQDLMEAGRGDHIAEHDPARVLREIDAKRQIVALHEAVPLKGCRECGATLEYMGDGPWCKTLRLLALPYADRAGYREEWRP